METFKEEKVVLFKVVYAGPGLCGKTTNLLQIFERLQSEQRLSQKVMEIPTAGDRTLSFEMMPLSSGKIGMFEAHFKLWTVPGQLHYQANRKKILTDADAIVFVADSQPSMREQNQIAFQETKIYLKSLNREHIPFAVQLNKRDMPDVTPVAAMLKDLDAESLPYFEASAINGAGVMETLQAITLMTRQSIKPTK